MTQYRHSTRGEAKTKEQIEKMLRSIGVSQITWGTDYDRGTTGVCFVRNNIPVRVEVSIQKFAQALLKENPHTYRHRISRMEHEDRLRDQAAHSVWSVLHDWFKAQTAIIKYGLMDVEEAFLAHVEIYSRNGMITMGEAIRKSLPGLVNGRLALPAAPVSDPAQ